MANHDFVAPHASGLELEIFNLVAASYDVFVADYMNSWLGLQGLWTLQQIRQHILEKYGVLDEANLEPLVYEFYYVRPWQTIGEWLEVNSNGWEMMTWNALYLVIRSACTMALASTDDEDMASSSTHLLQSVLESCDAEKNAAEQQLSRENGKSTKASMLPAAKTTPPATSQQPSSDVAPKKSNEIGKQQAPAPSKVDADASYHVDWLKNLISYRSFGDAAPEDLVYSTVGRATFTVHSRSMRARSTAIPSAGTMAMVRSCMQSSLTSESVHFTSGSHGDSSNPARANKYFPFQLDAADISTIDRLLDVARTWKRCEVVLRSSLRRKIKEKVNRQWELQEIANCLTIAQELGMIPFLLHETVPKSDSCADFPNEVRSRRVHKPDSSIHMVNSLSRLIMDSSQVGQSDLPLHLLSKLEKQLERLGLIEYVSADAQRILQSFQTQLLSEDNNCPEPCVRTGNTVCDTGHSFSMTIRADGKKCEDIPAECEDKPAGFIGGPGLRSSNKIARS